MKKSILITLLLGITSVFSACAADGVNGVDGASCTVADNMDGTRTIACTDGTSVTVNDGTTGADGTNGTDGSSCSVTDNGDETRTILCTDGTMAVIATGGDGADGADGTDGTDGTSCTVVDNMDGTKTLSCTDGTMVVVNDGTDGTDGSSCTVVDNMDGSRTLSCTDGTTVVINDGVDGTDGTDGTDGMDGMDGMGGMSGCQIELSSTGDTRLVCDNGTVSDFPIVQGTVRIVNGTVVGEGRLEVFNAGEWGTVCDDAFATVDATVACQQLGYTSGTEVGIDVFGQGTGTIWMDDVQCVGGESTLVSCP
ncbi:MAG: hypothetical protein ACI9KE_004023, partial [Polyangiales bacterium]